MSASVSISIATNTAIALSKGFGFAVTGSPTLFAETVHSLADVGNQLLLKVGEVRARGGPDRAHPFGHGQEKYFWALVSAVSVFFVGCGINLYHGVHSLLNPVAIDPFSPLVIGLLVFALALEAYTFSVALRELGGMRGLRTRMHDTTVLAVLLEDAVALVGILLTLVVAGAGWAWGPDPRFDAAAVYVSVTSLDSDRAGKLEPRAARPQHRLRAIRELAAAGIPVGVNVAPIIPGLTDHEMPAILKAAAEAGATSAGYTVVRLPYAVAPMF